MTSVANAINIAGATNALATRLIYVGLMDTSVATAGYYSDLSLSTIFPAPYFRALGLTLLDGLRL